MLLLACCGVCMCAHVCVCVCVCVCVSVCVCVCVSVWCANVHGHGHACAQDTSCVGSILESFQQREASTVTVLHHNLPFSHHYTLKLWTTAKSFHVENRLPANRTKGALAQTKYSTSQD